MGRGRPLHLFLVRHAESSKNTSGHFSTEAESEPLTSAGIRSATCIADALRGFAKESRFRVQKVYATRSVRAIDTARVIGERLEVPVASYPRLRSTGAGLLMGVKEEEAASSHPEFWHQLRLYRSGLFDAYRFTVAEGHEDKRDFERRVAACIDEILEKSGEQLKIIVAHRSSITATLLRFARQSLGYPEDFYGYVPIDLGNVCWLERGVDGDWRFRGINVNPGDLAALSGPSVA